MQINNPSKFHIQGLLIVLIFILIPPAFLFNYGLMPLVQDEPTRALIAKEIEISGNYIVPTINGEYYYNKPPVYNWIIAAIMHVSPEVNAFLIRLPAILSFFIFTFCVYRFAAPYLGKIPALMAALFNLTYGVWLFYGSLLGYIDNTFSLLVFCSFIAIYKYIHQDAYWKLFIVSYLLVAMGFLLKGMPALVFQGLTLVSVFVVEKKWKHLFKLPHLAGVFVFLFVVGTYFYCYARYNSLDPFFKTIWTESSKRTVLEKSYLDSFLYLFVFPFKQIFELLPWSLLILFCLRKESLAAMRHDKFIRFCFVVLLANSIPYWLSPDTQARYIQMLYPLGFIILVYAYMHFKDVFSGYTYWINRVFGVLCILACLATLAPLFAEQTSIIHYRYVKSILLFMAACGILFLFIRFPAQRIMSTVAMLLLVRIGFNM
ncbi:MAG: ArnT family glycosyltransferase, partial [Chitinophagales bacterium]